MANPAVVGMDGLEEEEQDYNEESEESEKDIFHHDLKREWIGVVEMGQE